MADSAAANAEIIDNVKELREYLQSLSSTGDIKIAIERRRPTHWGPDNKPIKGHIATFEEPISEEEIKDMFGGGTYMLRVSAPNKNGKLQYLTNRQVVIAGDPKITGLGGSEADYRPPSNGNGASSMSESPAVAVAAMRTMESMIDRSQKMAESQRAPDPAFQTLLQGLQLQMQEMQRALAVKDERILQLVTQKPDRTSSDMLLEKMIAGEHGQILAIRAQHESEMNALRERLTQEVDRAHSRAEDALRRQEDGHKRELQLVQMSYEGRIQALQAAHTGEVDGLKRQLQSETDSLKRELQFLHAQFTEAKSELGTLKSRKDKTPLETLQEVRALKDALAEDAPEEAPRGKLETLVETFAPAIEAVATRIATPPPPPAPPPAPPQPQVMQLPDGRIVARRADGTMQEVRKKPKIKMPSGEDLPETDPNDMAMAIAYLENACRNETDPESLVRSLSGTVPGSVVVAIRELGVDDFLTKVAKVPANSILRSTQAGKNWIREVGRLLVEQ